MPPHTQIHPRGRGTPPAVEKREVALSADKLSTNRTSHRGCFSYEMIKASNLWSDEEEYGLKNGIFGEGRGLLQHLSGGWPSERAPDK